jgi:hypothetical protein
MFIVIDWDYHCLVITDLTAILDKKNWIKERLNCSEKFASSTMHMRQQIMKLVHF